MSNAVPGVTQLAGGAVLAIVGAISYLKSKTLVPSVLLGGSAGFVIPPLLWILGFVRWSVKFQYSGASIIMAVIAIPVILYVGGSNRPF